MTIQKQWKHAGINEWVDTNLLDSSPYYQNIRTLVEQGELHEAFTLAEHSPKEEVSSFRLAALRRTVNNTMSQIVEWQTKCNKELHIVEPEDWLEIPRYNTVCEIIKDAKPIEHHVPNILDIGCYTGYFIRGLQERAGGPSSCHACDVQQDMMEYLDLKYKDARPPVKYFTHNVEVKLVRTYHIITMLELLTHVLDPVAALDTSLDALAPGGLILLTASTSYNERCPDRERLRSFDTKSILSLIDDRTRHKWGNPRAVEVKQIHSEYKNPELVVTLRR
ncbi:MAG: class I SAM-dependent methyltransferase [Candidatus Thorarchaeota archaeon]|jgi:2-polyprenyl-3-methyl-5-hydroxy-6-metoxy-1,4-benzoquinol methylase